MALAHSPRIITDGLVLCLDAANTKSYPGSGTTWTDLSGRGNNGTLVNGVGYSSSNLGSLSFDGVNDYGRITSNIFNNTLPNFSISIWYKNSVNGILFGNHYHGAVWESIWTSNTDFGVNGAADPTTNRQFLAFTSPPYNVWNNIVFVNNSSSSYMKVFNGGIEIATKTATVIPWNSSIIPTIGAQLQNTGQIVSPINGNISSILIYNRALSAAEILQNFNAFRGRFGI